MAVDRFNVNRVKGRLYMGAFDPGLLMHAPVIMCAPLASSERRFIGHANLMYFPFNDDINPPTQSDESAIESAASCVLHVWIFQETKIGFTYVADAGTSVVVCCREGRNRSGVVMGRVLMSLGMKATEAVALIQHTRARSLQNPFFVEYLKSCLKSCRP